MLCFVEHKGVHLVDTNTFDMLAEARVPDEKLRYCDWNTRDPNLIARMHLNWSVF